ncbi:hypothetical protein N7520_008806 [Penicillium odoratum]|uniref:uncharacterized protein n=1 Tax=Penicillium odoratum TaxID=1167516 RepID=UPI00254973C3|nr:uncharacterized protein N7520_008806 [Penicillium odoratum]KAJ5751889.1 hypothetical protein N7520_008806 [Penicillium odoratum]
MDSEKAQCAEHVEEQDVRHIASKPEGPAVDEELTALQTVKQHPKAIIYCFCMSICTFVYGFDLIIINVVTAMPAFQVAFGDSTGDGSYTLPAQWLSLWSSMVSVGIMGGAYATGPIADRIGSRILMIFGGLLTIGGALICTFSETSEILNTKRSMFLIGKIVVGLGLGFQLPASQTYVSEVAPLRIRGPLLSLFTLFMVIGQIIAVVGVDVRLHITTAAAFRILFASEVIPAGIAILAVILTPDSPTFLVKKGKVEKAVRAFTRIYSSRGPEAQEGVGAIEAALEHEKQAESTEKKASYIECFQGANWRRTRIVFYANILQNLVGIAMISNATYFLELGGMTATVSLLVTTASLCLLIPAILISWYTMATFGRRTILLWSVGAITLIWLAIGIAGCFSTTTAFWFVGCAIVAVNFTYGLGVGGTYPVISSETSTLRLRAQTQSLAFIAQFFFMWGFNYAVPYMYQTDEGNLGGKVGFIFSGLSALGWIIFFFEVPEMKDRTIAELDHLFEMRTPTRAFKGQIVPRH